MKKENVGHSNGIFMRKTFYNEGGIINGKKTWMMLTLNMSKNFSKWKKKSIVMKNSWRVLRRQWFIYEGKRWQFESAAVLMEGILKSSFIY